MEAAIAESGDSKEIDLEATIPKGIAVDDPVRMYLKMCIRDRCKYLSMD